MTDLLKELDAQSKFLRKAAAEIAAAGHAGWGNTCLQAAEALDTHHAEIAEAVKLAKWYRGLRDSDPDNGEPYIARERQDSWGKWKTEWLGGLDADRAIATTHKSAREDGE